MVRLTRGSGFWKDEEVFGQEGSGLQIPSRRTGAQAGRGES